MSSKVITKMQKTAEALYDMRRRIEAKEEENRQELEALKTERDAMQALLLADMKKYDLLSLKVKSGDSFYVGSKKGIEVVDPIAAMKWAMTNHAVSINKVMVAQKLRDADAIPDGFSRVETEFISVRKKAGKTKVEDGEIKGDN